MVIGSAHRELPVLCQAASAGDETCDEVTSARHESRKNVNVVSGSDGFLLHALEDGAEQAPAAPFTPSNIISLNDVTDDVTETFLGVNPYRRVYCLKTIRHFDEGMTDKPVVSASLWK